MAAAGGVSGLVRALVSVTAWALGSVLVNRVVRRNNLLAIRHPSSSSSSSSSSRSSLSSSCSNVGVGSGSCKSIEPSSESESESIRSNSELLDVLDAEGNKSGRTATRSEVHQRGLFHRAIHCWIYNPNTRQLLIQQRAAYKLSWPNCWDISSAGHLEAGDSSLRTCQKELKEELGISISIADTEEERNNIINQRPYSRDGTIELNGTKKNVHVNWRTFINNEYADVYLLSQPDLDLSTLVLQREEVNAVRWIDVAELERKLLVDKDPAFVPPANPEAAKKFFNYVKALA